MSYSRMERLHGKTISKQRFSIRKVSTVGAVSALLGTALFVAGGVQADQVTVADTANGAEAQISQVGTQSNSQLNPEVGTVNSANTVAEDVVDQPKVAVDVSPARATESAQEVEIASQNSQETVVTQSESVAATTVDSQEKTDVQVKASTEALADEVNSEMRQSESVQTRRLLADTAGPTNQPAQAKTVTESQKVAVGVINYSKDKPTFDVIVDGNVENKAIKGVRIAVWSEKNGQDDLRWYQPKVVNNKAIQTVDIKNHEGKTGDYNVHLYTDYLDGTVKGRILGRFHIEVPEPKKAEVAVTNYAKNKTTFDVVVKGTDKPVKDVRVAVWSEQNGQDDLKWYLPKVVNNRATQTVDIKNHEGKTGDYNVHVYTTYTDGSLDGRNLGRFRIDVAEPKKADVAVINYNKDKTTFDVVVKGSDKSVKDVRIAVWSEQNGQDDLKWYLPKVVNNKATQTVDIKNHEGRTGDYNVHVYTTYTDGLVDGRNLGRFHIEVTEPRRADVEVVNYAKDKTTFDVLVKGSKDTKQIKDVRIAVWSEENGQDDIKWYLPQVDHNQASQTVDIKKHEGKTGDYNVHVYTTYTDGVVDGRNLGRYHIDVAEPKIVRPDIVVENYSKENGTLDLVVTGDNTSVPLKDIRVAVWSEKNQSNIHWYVVPAKDNAAKAHVNIANHHYIDGNYNIHVYSDFQNGKTTAANAGSYELQMPLANQLKSVLTIASNLLGTKTGSAEHHRLVADYNSVEPKPVGYTVKDWDDWCDIFVTTVFQRAGLSNLIGRECGVERHIQLFKQKGIWNEDGSVTPKIGDIITFNWDQNYQQNDGFADHIGIVEKVADGVIHTIEGNTLLMGQKTGVRQVARKSYNIGNGNIRGFATPKYI